MASVNKLVCVKCDTNLDEEAVNYYNTNHGWLEEIGSVRKNYIKYIILYSFFEDIFRRKSLKNVTKYIILSHFFEPHLPDLYVKVIGVNVCLILLHGDT